MSSHGRDHRLQIKDYRIDKIREFASHFAIPLLSTAYDKRKFRLEWRNFCHHVSLNLPRKKPVCSGNHTKL